MSTYFEAAVGMIGTGASKLRKLELKFSWGGGGEISTCLLHLPKGQYSWFF